MINTTGIADTCEPAFDDSLFRKICLAPAIIIILILSMLSKRRKLCPESCNGRPGPVMPLNLLDGFENRWTFGVAIGATTSQVLLLWTDFLGSKQDVFAGDIPTEAYVPVFMLSVLIVSIDCYPFFACLSSPHRIIGPFLGLLYSAMWFTTRVTLLATCPDPFPKVLPYFEFIIELPTVVCLLFLTLQYLLLFRNGLMTRYYPGDNNVTIAYNHHLQHVRQLLIRENIPTTKTFFEKHIYSSIPHFIFTTRMISTMIITSFLLYTIEVSFATFGSFSVVEIRKLIGLIDTNRTIFGVNATTFKSTLNSSTIIIEVSWFLALAFTVLCSVINIAHIMKCHRKHLLRAYKGENLFTIVDGMSPAELMGYGMKYSGYQVAHFVWGILILHIVILLVCIIIALIIYAVINDPSVIVPALVYILILILAYVLMWLCPRALSHAVFLQGRINDYDKYKPLAVANRYSLHNFNYYAFFWMIFIGLGTCLLRIMKSFGLGVMMLSRIDRSVLMRGWEKWDIGYMAYVALLKIEHTHNHPALRVFCQFLSDSQSVHSAGQYSNGDSLSSKKAKLRWHLAYTLLNNPSTISFRKQDFNTHSENTLDHWAKHKVAVFERDTQYQEDSYNDAQKPSYGSINAPI